MGIRYMGIDLSRRYIAVSKQFLDDAEIGSPFQEMCRIGMTQFMRREMLLDPGCICMFVESILYIDRIDEMIQRKEEALND